MKRLYYCLCFFVFTNVVSAQQWVNCTNGDQITSLLEVDDELWIGTRGGLVYYAPDSEVPQFFNRGNSGMPGNWVMDIEKSADGRIWVATTKGLGAFDGNEWQRHDTIQRAQLALMNDGSVVAATNEGLYHWVDNQWIISEFFSCGYEVTDLEVNPLNNEIWVTSYTFGCISVDRFDGETWTRYNYNNSTLPFESPAINSIAITADGVVWVGTWNSLHRFSDEVWEVIDFGGLIEEGVYVSSIEEAPNGDLWAIAQSQFLGSPDIEVDLIRFDGENWATFSIPDTLAYNYQIPIFLPGAQQFYLGTNGKGLFATNLTDFTSLNTSNSPLPGNQVSKVIRQEEQIWLGTNIYTPYGNAITSVNGSQWTVFDPEFNIRLKFVDPTGKLWASSDQYTFLTLENGIWQPVDFAALGAPDLEGITNVAFDQEDNLWIFGNTGVARYNGSDWTLFGTNQTGIINGIYIDVAFDPGNNDLWIGTYYGAVRYNGSQWQAFSFQGNGSPNQPAVNAFAFGLDGTTYAGTQFGLYIQEGNVFQLVEGTGQNQLVYGIYSLFVDNVGDLWAGSLDYLVRYRDGIQDVFDLQNSGLPDGNIGSISQDANGNLWLATLGGVALYNANGVNLENTHTAITPAVSTLAFQVSPNPVGKEDTLVVVLAEKANKHLRTRILDLQGRQIWSRAYANVGDRFGIDLRTLHLAAGVYVLQVETEAGVGITKMVVE